MSLADALQTEVEKVNQRMMDRYKQAVIVELSGDAVHVTIGGENFVNDEDAFDRAMALLKTCSLARKE